MSEQFAANIDNLDRSQRDKIAEGKTIDRILTHIIELNRGLMSNSTTMVLWCANVHSQVHKLISQYTHRNCTMYNIQTMIAGFLLMCPVFTLRDKSNVIT